MTRIKLTATLLAALLLTACQSGEPEQLPVDEPDQSTVSREPMRSESRAERTPREPTREVLERNSSPAADPARELPSLVGQLDSSGYGMTMMIDGSSPQAFADSLEIIAADTSPEQYQQFDSAVRFLQAYSLGTNNLSDFYRTIDGLTPEEVIEKARNQRGGR